MYIWLMHVKPAFNGISTARGVLAYNPSLWRFLACQNDAIFVNQRHLPKTLEIAILRTSETSGEHAPWPPYMIPAPPWFATPLRECGAWKYHVSYKFFVSWSLAACRRFLKTLACHRPWESHGMHPVWLAPVLIGQMWLESWGFLHLSDL